MKNSIKRTLCLIALLFVVFAASCGEKDKPADNTDKGGETYKIEYVLNGGTNAANAPTSYTKGVATALPTNPTKDGEKFDGWFANAEFTGSAVKFIGEDETGDKKFYAKWKKDASDLAPKGEINTINFNGKGMKIGIKVLPASSYDPFNAGYTGEHKELKQAYQRMVEKAYNVLINYSEWGDSAAWGPERVKYIKDSYSDGSFKQDDVYVVDIASQWISTLVAQKTLAPLFDMSNDTGYFADAEYEQDSTKNAAFSVNKKVYGYSLGTARADYFLYYNATKVNQLGLEDPAELWLSGEWNWSKFESWTQTGQTNLTTGQVIDAGAAEFLIGAVASSGNQMVDSLSGTVMMVKSSVTTVFDKMQTLYSGGYWNKGHGTNDVTGDFLQGKTIMATGDLWFLKEATRFDPQQITFEIGVVPYPVSDSDGITAYTEPYTYSDSEGNEIEVNEPLKTRDGEVLKNSTGDEVYGVNLESSSFQLPYTGSSCYAILNFENGNNGINSEIVFNIVNDLFGKEPDDPNQQILSDDNAYRSYLEGKLDNAIDIEVIMSTQNSSYFELIEILSMTVGNGSHFGPDAFWPLASSILSTNVNAATKLREVETKYKNALKQIGY